MMRAAIVAVAFLLTAGTANAATTMYASKDAALTGERGGTIGTVMPATRLSPTGANAGSSDVVIEGWHPKTESTLIYGGIDSRVLLVRLSGSNDASVKTVGTKTDAYGDTWDEVRISGRVPTSALVPNIVTVWTAAQAFYGQRCSTCHTLHQPTQFTLNQWPSLVADMAHNAALTTQQEDLIVSYLQAHARKN